MLILSPQQATPSTLAAVLSVVSSPVFLPQQKPQWALDVKVFKASSENRFMYQITTTTGSVRDSKILVNRKLYPTGQSSEGKNVLLTYGQADPLDTLIQAKLQSQWALRQTLTGDSSFAVDIYLRGVKVALKATNVFLQGSFRCLLVMVEGLPHNEVSVNQLREVLGFDESCKIFQGVSLEQVLVKALGLD